MYICIPIPGRVSVDRDSLKDLPMATIYKVETLLQLSSGVSTSIVRLVTGHSDKLLCLKGMFELWLVAFM